MTKQEVFDGLKEVVAVIRPKTDLSNVDFETPLVTGLGIDSLTMMLLSLAVEEKFNIRFPENMPAPKTVGEICDAVISAPQNLN